MSGFIKWISPSLFSSINLYYYILDWQKEGPRNPLSRNKNIPPPLSHSIRDKGCGFPTSLFTPRRIVSWGWTKSPFRLIGGYRWLASKRLYGERRMPWHRHPDGIFTSSGSFLRQTPASAVGGGWLSFIAMDDKSSNPFCNGPGLFANPSGPLWGRSTQREDRYGKSWLARWLARNSLWYFQGLICR